jgi:hypothetical protein
MGKCKDDDCGCQKGLTTPAPCPPSTPCGEYQPCVDYVNAGCVQYTGDDIICNEEVVVEQGALLENFLPNLVERVCNNTNSNLLYARVEITSAQLRTAFTTPIPILSAPGIGKFIDIVTVTEKYTFLTDVYKFGGSNEALTHLFYEEQLSNVDPIVSLGDKGNAGNSSYIIRGYYKASYLLIENKGVDYRVYHPDINSDGIDGEGTVVVYVLYRIVDL